MTRLPVSLVLLSVLGLGSGLRGLHRQKLRMEQTLASSHQERNR